MVVSKARIVAQLHDAQRHGLNTLTAAEIDQRADEYVKMLQEVEMEKQELIIRLEKMDAEMAPLYKEVRKAVIENVDHKDVGEKLRNLKSQVDARRQEILKDNNLKDQKNWDQGNAALSTYLGELSVYMDGCVKESQVVLNGVEPLGIATGAPYKGSNLTESYIQAFLKEDKEWFK